MILPYLFHTSIYTSIYVYIHIYILFTVSSITLMLSYVGNIHLSCISGEWCASGPGLPPTTRVDAGQLYAGEGAKRCSADGGASIYRYG